MWRWLFIQTTRKYHFDNIANRFGVPLLNVCSTERELQFLNVGYPTFRSVLEGGGLGILALEGQGSREIPHGGKCGRMSVADASVSSNIG